jgi:hypothetical protein
LVGIAGVIDGFGVANFDSFPQIEEIFEVFAVALFGKFGGVGLEFRITESELNIGIAESMGLATGINAVEFVQLGGEDIF